MYVGSFIRLFQVQKKEICLTWILQLIALFILFADMFLALDKDMNGTLSKQELREYADGTLTEIFIERGRT